MDGRNAAPPKKPWHDDYPANTHQRSGFHGFLGGAKWIWSIHSRYPHSAVAMAPCYCSYPSPKRGIQYTPLIMVVVGKHFTLLLIVV